MPSIFNDAASMLSTGTRRGSKRHSHSTPRSRRRPSDSSDDEPRRPSIPSSLFGAALGGSASRSSFFRSSGSHSHSRSGRPPSYYKRQPRPSFLTRLYRHLRRLLRDLLHFLKRHPLRVALLVLLPLITSGALVALLARVGLRIPNKIDRWLRTGARAASGDAIGAVGEAVQLARGRGFQPVGAGFAGRNGERGYYQQDQVVRRNEGGGFWSSAVKFFTE